MTAADAGAGAHGGARAWLIWALGSLCFAYAFFQRVAPSVMVDELMRDFAVGAAVLGNLSAIYFYAYAGLQIPVGMALDRWGPRRMLTGAISLAALGSAIFATADSLALAYLGRLMIGAGSAVGFVGTLMLVSRWFPIGRFAFLSGMTMLVAMAGGVLGQAPLAPVVEAVGWRATLAGAGAFGVVLAVTIWLLVRDRPPGQAADSGHTAGRAGLLADLRVVLSSRQNWVVGFYGAAMSGPMLSYAALWGVPHMMHIHGLGRAAAAGSASLVLLGWAVGAPVAGWFSDRIGRRKLPLMVAAALTLVVWIVGALRAGAAAPGRVAAPVPHRRDQRGHDPLLRHRAGAGAAAHERRRGRLRQQLHRGRGRAHVAPRGPVPRPQLGRPHGGRCPHLFARGLRYGLPHHAGRHGLGRRAVLLRARDLVQAVRGLIPSCGDRNPLIPVSA